MSHNGFEQINLSCAPSPTGLRSASTAHHRGRHDRKIHQRSRGTYGKRRIRAELLDTYDMNVDHKLVSAIMTELGIAGLPRPGKRNPNQLGVETLSDRVNRGFTASRPNELWFTDITEHPGGGILGTVADGIAEHEEVVDAAGLTAAMADHIDNFHNAERRHSYLGNISPIEYEKLWADIQPYPQLS